MKNKHLIETLKKLDPESDVRFVHKEGDKGIGVSILWFVGLEDKEVTNRWLEDEKSTREIHPLVADGIEKRPPFIYLASTEKALHSDPTEKIDVLFKDTDY